MSDVGPRIPPHVPPHRRFLGLERADDDRMLLGLPAEDGAGLRSGQIEAALERRLDEVARHPLAQSGEARRLAADLEAAADRLQSSLDPAVRGPLHPAAARRAARRRALEPSEEARDAAGGASRGPTGPQAPRVVRPTTGLTADDLTDFDRLALAVLVVSRGWNARSAKRLATFASTASRGATSTGSSTVSRSSSPRARAFGEPSAKSAPPRGPRGGPRARRRRQAMPRRARSSASSRGSIR